MAYFSSNIYNHIQMNKENKVKLWKIIQEAGLDFLKGQLRETCGYQITQIIQKVETLID